MIKCEIYDFPIVGLSEKKICLKQSNFIFTLLIQRDYKCFLFIYLFIYLLHTFSLPQKFSFTIDQHFIESGSDGMTSWN